jgi:hypothetical protein
MSDLKSRLSVRFAPIDNDEVAPRVPEPQTTYVKPEDQEIPDDKSEDIMINNRRHAHNKHHNRASQLLKVKIKDDPIMRCYDSVAEMSQELGISTACIYAATKNGECMNFRMHNTKTGQVVFIDLMERLPSHIKGIKAETYKNIYIKALTDNTNITREAAINMFLTSIMK